MSPCLPKRLLFGRTCSGWQPLYSAELQHLCSLCSLCHWENHTASSWHWGSLSLMLQLHQNTEAAHGRKDIGRTVLWGHEMRGLAFLLCMHSFKPYIIFSFNSSFGSLSYLQEHFCLYAKVKKIVIVLGKCIFWRYVNNTCCSTLFWKC